MIRHSFKYLSIVGYCLCLFASSTRAENRSYDGSGNNELNTSWGAAGTQLRRLLPAVYGDGISSPAGASRESARYISNVAITQTLLVPNQHQMTDWVFQWGQFIDHDLDLSGSASPAEAFNISVPAGDAYFDPLSTGTQVIPLSRSIYDVMTGTDSDHPRQQINQITSYLDGSNVYGSSEARALALREMSGGRLKSSTGDLLPFNTLNLDNAMPPGYPTPADYYVAGDIRANEQVGLTAIHTLMMREHNRIADELNGANFGSDEEIYQRARKLVGAEIQVITYQEFLPALLGETNALDMESSYQPNLEASIANEFSTALFRVGHTMLPPQLMRMTNEGTEADGGHMALQESFFKPGSLNMTGELDYILKGLASDQQQEVDMHVIDDVRNFLFGPPGAGGFDLASLNIQRGRDHGLPDYNSVRAVLNLPAAQTFADITSDPEVQLALQTVYQDIDDVDVWVGAIAEDHVAGGAVGELIAEGLKEQFSHTRDGDRFWYRNDPDFTPDDVAWLESIRLSDLIRWNTSITNLQENVFFMAVPEPSAIGLVLIALPFFAAPKRRPRRRVA